MTCAQELFVRAARAAMRAESVEIAGKMELSQWEEFFALCRSHKLLPAALTAVCSCPQFRELPAEERSALVAEATRQVASQTQRSFGICSLSARAQQRGLKHLVMKGIACRSLYPRPDERPSADEDLLVEDFEGWCGFLQEEGFRFQNPGAEPERDFEIGFLRGGEYIELHRKPFAPDSPVMGKFNAQFEGSVERARPLETELGSIPVMEPGEHLLYLLLHAYKHFIHSGFGLRQLCDIVLWVEKYGPEIEWEKVLKALENLGLRHFAAAVFQLGKAQLGLHVEKANLPTELFWEKAPCAELLEDMLSGGIYGSASKSRVHSSGLTLRFVEGEKGSGVLANLFPAAEKMEHSYPFLKGKRALLPLAWGLRILGYAREVLTSKGDSSPAESVEIARKRKELFKKLEINVS